MNTSEGKLLGLGYFSEQVLESCHQNFAKFNNFYTSGEKRLLRATVNYNLLHLNFIEEIELVYERNICIDHTYLSKYRILNTRVTYSNSGCRLNNEYYRLPNCTKILHIMYIMDMIYHKLGGIFCTTVGVLQIFFVINWKFPTLTWKNRASLTCNIAITCSKDTHRMC